MSEVDLAGKRVFVVGGETALGRAVLIGLAEAGADIAVGSLTPDTKAEFAINSALNELWALGRKGVALAIDAKNADQLGSALEQAERELGTIDLMVAVGEVASDTLDERKVIAVAGDSAPEEALRTIRDRLMNIAWQN